LGDVSGQPDIDRLADTVRTEGGFMHRISETWDEEAQEFLIDTKEDGSRKCPPDCEGCAARARRDAALDELVALARDRYGSAYASEEYERRRVAEARVAELEDEIVRQAADFRLRLDREVVAAVALADRVAELERQNAELGAALDGIRHNGSAWVLDRLAAITTLQARVAELAEIADALIQRGHFDPFLPLAEMRLIVGTGHYKVTTYDEEQAWKKRIERSAAGRGRGGA
jgi:hypothetical protein